MARLVDCSRRMGGLVAIAVGFLVGAWAALLGFRFPHAWMACVVVLGLGLVLASSVRRSAARPARRAWPVFFALAAVAGQAMAAAPIVPRAVPNGVARIEGEVLRVRYGDDARGLLRVDRGRALDGSGAISRGTTIEVRGLDAAPGTRLRLLARVSPIARFDNPTPHPEWPTARRMDARGRLVGRAEPLAESPLWSHLAHTTRRTVRARLVATLSPTAAGLARTLLLGEASALDDDERDRVRDVGLSHVLAVSGLHVTLLAGALVWLLRLLLLRVPRLAARVDVGRVARAIGVPFALLYAGLVGDAPSAWRAAITASIGWGLLAAGRRAHPVGVAAAAALVLGVLRPDDLGRPGFILSILATASLVSGPTNPEASPLESGLEVGARTMVATAPMVLWLFGDLPFIGLLANLVVVPVAALVILPLIAVHASLAVFAPPLSSVTAPVVEVLARAFFATCEVFRSASFGRDLPPLDLWQGVAVAAGCGGLLLVRSWRARLAVLLAMLAAVGAAEVRLRAREAPTDGVRVTFLDVGQGDAALVDLPDGRLMVIDAGGSPSGGPDPGARVLVPLLRARRRSRIDVLVLSHPHPDHYGGMPALFEAFDVGEIWDSGQAGVENDDGTLAGLLESARRRGVPVRGPPELCPATRRFGAAEARVLWPCPDFDSGWGPNENSIVVMLSYADRRVLMTGDAEAHAEASLLGLDLPSVDVLKVAHHGSRTSSDEALLSRLRPGIAVVSAGRQNQFGHPHADVWERLERHAGRALSTAEDGGVVVRITARELTVEGPRGRIDR